MVALSHSCKVLTGRQELPRDPGPSSPHHPTTAHIGCRSRVLPVASGEGFPALQPLTSLSVHFLPCVDTLRAAGFCYRENLMDYLSTFPSQFFLLSLLTPELVLSSSASGAVHSPPSKGSNELKDHKFISCPTSPL